LLRKAGGQGRVLAVEALVATGTARETLKQPKGNPPLKEVMERGEHPYGMATFEMALERLEREGLIERADPSAGLRG
jgi:twitching motility protein PilT